MRITIEGKTFELSKADAIKLRDSLNDAVGQQPSTTIIERERLPYYNPPPSFWRESFDPARQDQITCMSDRTKLLSFQ